MSLLEELFGVDEAEEAEALERVIEGGSDNEEPPGNPEDEAEEDRRTIDPSKPKSVRVVKNPQVVLNAARLTGPRGLQTLPEHFSNFVFKGKGHEKEDLDLVLKKLEHWAHRLYPKFQFDDCLKKIESLGHKRPVLVALRKLRSDQLTSAEVVEQRDSSEDEAPKDDEFDRLLQQQIDLARERTPRAPSAVRTPSLAPKATSSPSISEEQKLRMLRSKQLAEERRNKRNSNQQIVDLTGYNQPINTASKVTDDENGEIIDLAKDSQNNDSNSKEKQTTVDLTEKNKLISTVSKKFYGKNNEMVDLTGVVQVNLEKGKENLQPNSVREVVDVSKENENINVDLDNFDIDMEVDMIEKAHADKNVVTYNDSSEDEMETGIIVNVDIHSTKENVGSNSNSDNVVENAAQMEEVNVVPPSENILPSNSEINDENLAKNSDSVANNEISLSNTEENGEIDQGITTDDKIYEAYDEMCDNFPENDVANEDFDW